jgi:hypothetical protein
MTTNINVVIVEKTKSLKSLCIKSFKEDELYKKCGFKTDTNFEKQGEWSVSDKNESLVYIISLYGKTKGKAGSENMYDFPPPHDTTLFFGNCLLVCHTSYEGEDLILEDLTVELWEKLYDELEHIASSLKTKEGGYLKDGFVVDDDEEPSVETGEYEEEEEEDDGYEEDDSELSEESFLFEEAG